MTEDRIDKLKSEGVRLDKEHKEFIKNMWKSNKSLRDQGYLDCECGHSTLWHKFPSFGRWFINLFKGGYKKCGDKCQHCDCQRVRNAK